MPRTIERTREEVAEIERHKYFLSEKAGYDVGWEAAEKDWDEHHAAQFREAQRPRSSAAEHTAHDVQLAPRGGLRMLFHRMFLRKDSE